MLKKNIKISKNNNMKKIRNIIAGINPPKANDLWIDTKDYNIKFWKKGSWTSLGKSAFNTSTEIKGNSERIDEINKVLNDIKNTIWDDWTDEDHVVLGVKTKAEKAYEEIHKIRRLDTLVSELNVRTSGLQDFNIYSAIHNVTDSDICQIPIVEYRSTDDFAYNEFSLRIPYGVDFRDYATTLYDIVRLENSGNPDYRPVVTIGGVHIATIDDLEEALNNTHTTDGYGYGYGDDGDDNFEIASTPTIVINSSTSGGFKYVGYGSGNNIDIQLENPYSPGAAVSPDGMSKNMMTTYVLIETSQMARNIMISEVSNGSPISIYPTYLSMSGQSQPSFPLSIPQNRAVLFKFWYIAGVWYYTMMEGNQVGIPIN